MAICPSCGEENPDRARFCLACAAPLTTGPAQQAERKVVSVIFVDLVGFTAESDAADPEDVHATLKPYHARVRDEIERLGGVVEKYVGDAVMAVFGAPVAHEDDAERAVRAGLKVIDATRELGLEARAAVNTGEALVALGARPERGEALVAGDVVNTASRLQGRADTGTLVVGEITYRTTRHQIDYEPLEPVPVKGKAEPVPLWRARGPRSRFGVDVEIGGTTPLVGRDSELSTLKETYARVRRDDSVQLVTLVGEAGVGKTRLLRELGQWLDDEPDLVYWRQGRCLPYGEGITFWALGEIVKAQAGILESDDTDAAAAKVAASVEAVVPDATEQEWIRARLAPLLGISADGGAGSSREESFTAWRGYLEAVAAQRPLVLLFEDLHWADAALLDFLDHLLDWSLGVPMLVLCTARPELYELHSSWGGGKRNSTTVSLTPLPPDDTARLLHALLDQSVLPAETQALLLERCGGNPLYAEQFARMLADGGEDAGVPETVQAVISARLDALGPERKALLQDAAVVGKVFWAEALAAVSALDERAVLAGLVDLAHRDLIRSARTSSIEAKREFAFAHLLVRDVAYGQIPRAERAQKHRLVAEWIEAAVGERVADHAELLAYHYSEALELATAAGAEPDATEPLRGAAVRMFLAAAKRAEDLDVRPWIENLDRALELASPEERPEVLIEHARAVNVAGRTAEGRAEAEEAISLLEGTGKNILLGRALSELSWVLAFTTDSAASTEAHEAAIATLEREPPGLDLATAYAASAGMLMMEERSEECLAVCERIRPVVEQHGDAATWTRFHEFRGISRVATGDVERGLQELREALDSAVRSFHPMSVAAFVNLGYWTWWVEGPARGAELFSEGVEYAARRGIPGDWAEAELCWALFDLGAWDDVLARTERLIQGAQLADMVVLEAMVRPTRGRILLARGHVDEARADAEASVALVETTDIPQSIVPSLTLAAGVAATTGDTARAKDLLVELEQRSRGRARSRGIEVAEAARVAAGVRETEPVERILADPFPPVQRANAQRLAARAIVAEASAAFDDALALHTEAADAWRAFGHIYEHGHAHAGAGRCALALGRDGEADLAEARKLFAKLGAKRDLGELDELLGGAAAAAS